MKTLERRTKPARSKPVPASGVDVRIANRVLIPATVRDHESFREWATSPECPEKLRVAFFNNSVWVDADMEQFFTHNQVKAEFTAVLLHLARTAKLGRFATEGMLLTHPAARLSTIPDGFLVGFESVRAGRLRMVTGKQSGCVEYVGSADMVLEVVSDSSVDKDLIDLPLLYWKAGVAEYWLVDARGATVQFEILKRGPKAYSTTRRQSGGWLKSEVFGRSFRLVRSQDEVGEPLDSLEVK
jgi:Uma2 family endonuclease